MKRRLEDTRSQSSGEQMDTEDDPNVLETDMLREQEKNKLEDDESLDSDSHRRNPKKCPRKSDSDEEDPSDHHLKRIRFAEGDSPECDATSSKASLGSDPVPKCATRSISKDDRFFVPEFEQPGDEAQFMERVRNQKICLENVVVSDLKVTGTVRVLNMGFSKEVAVRYSLNEWACFFEEKADYIPESSDDVTDKFSFSITPQCMRDGGRLIFVLRYSVNGEEFWDNNRHRNYIMKYQQKRPRPKERLI
ncbi:protein phosphatase 1 regulatory subunit 3D [Caerostris darwini]|uniref:Protein phosphatase 1 regulatory subunit 3D n=1 Tax=Caerostris darwini TaxID=1538125 RepID=A0AAV4M7U4_9ARAC|nr:protein phosphatase 1 regulatory subunit 3D [Caerostris darwini]